MTQAINKPTLWQRIQRQWKNNPLFSTALVLVLMIILQTIALGFDFDTFGKWFMDECSSKPRCITFWYIGKR